MVFNAEETYNNAFHRYHEPDAPTELWSDYKASSHLEPLLTCRQFYTDAHLLALSRTLFIVTNPYIALDIGNHLSTRLRKEQIESLRYMAFVADARHFRQLGQWRSYPFGQPALQLDELSIILHRSSYWHYLFDFNVALCTLLRSLTGVQRVTFIRNNALVKGTLHTWYNRFIKLVLKTDHQERYSKSPPCPETSWWNWEHSPSLQTVSLSNLPAKCADLTKEAYDLVIKPLQEKLLESMESEVEDPDPMSRVSVGL